MQLLTRSSNLAEPGNLIVILTILVIVSTGVYYLYLSGSARALAFFRLSEYRGEALAEGRGLATSYSIGAVLAVAVLMVVLFYSSTVRIPSSAVTSIFFVTVASVTLLGFVMRSTRSRLILERGGLLYGLTRARLMSFVPMDKIASMRIDGRLLKVRLVEDPVYLTRRRSYLLLGDFSELRMVVEKLAPGGEMMPALAVLPSRKEAGLVLVRENVQTVKHHTIASLLLASGIATAVNGYVLTEMTTVITSIYGPYSVPQIIPCCAIIEFIIAAIVLMGSFMAFRSRRADLVSAAGWLSIIGLGGIIVSPVLGIASLWLLREERDEFKS